MRILRLPASRSYPTAIHPSVEIVTAYKGPSRLGLVPELPPSLVGNFSAPGFPLHFSASLTLSLIISLSIQIGCRGVNSMSSPAPQPSGGGGPVTTSSGVKHLIVVIMQNNSFDHLFGTFPGVNGLQPSDPGFSQLDAGGKSVTPSLLSNVNPVDMTHDS